MCPQPGCGLPFADLEAPPPGLHELERSRALTHAYEDLLRTAEGREPLPVREIGARLRAALFAAGMSRDEDPTFFSRVSTASTATIAEVLVRAGASAVEALGQPMDPKERARGTRRAVPLSLGTACPNPSCAGGAKIYDNGRHTALGGKHERLCLACGTRWTDDRILFSFDRVPGYPISRASAHAARLVNLRKKVDDACAQAVRNNQKVVQTHILRTAGVPKAIAYLSKRAGLVDVIHRWRDIQLAA